jgi:hypothetical protein
MHTSPNRIDVDVRTLRSWRELLRQCSDVVVHSGSMTKGERITLHKRIKQLRDGIDVFLNPTLPDVVVDRRPGFAVIGPHDAQPTRSRVGQPIDSAQVTRRRHYGGDFERKPSCDCPPDRSCWICK